MRWSNTRRPGRLRRPEPARAWTARVTVAHLSCREGQAEGVDQGAECGEAAVDRLDVRERHQLEPGEQQAGTDIRLQEQSQGVEVMFPAGAGIPGWMGLQV